MVFAVAHNSGDAIPTTLEAVGAVAGIIEIDVASLDRKESSGAFVALLLQFLDRHRGGRPIMVVSSDRDVIPVLAERGAETLRFLGIADEPSLVRPQGDDQLAGLIDGVSIRHTLLNEERAAWLEDRRRLTLAWTINDLKRLNELVELGVDAVTTDNLAIM